MTTMQQIVRIECLARAEGLTYGEYMKRYGEPFPKLPSLKENERICKKCGCVFEREVLKNGNLSERVNCPKCVAENRDIRDKKRRNSIENGG